SPWVQALWSSQSVPSVAFVSLQAPLAGLHTLTLQGPLGVHETASPLQTPPRQLSSWVQGLPSSQGLASGRRWSAGQAAPSPGQCSTKSQALAAGRQIVDAGKKPLGGQAPLLQTSATSQGPAAARQGVP